MVFLLTVLGFFPGLQLAHTVAYLIFLLGHLVGHLTC